MIGLPRGISMPSSFWMEKKNKKTCYSVIVRLWPVIIKLAASLNEVYLGFFRIWFSLTNTSDALIAFLQFLYVIGLLTLVSTFFLNNNLFIHFCRIISQLGARLTNFLMQRRKGGGVRLDCSWMWRNNLPIWTPYRRSRCPFRTCNLKNCSNSIDN